jgi:hypothetical protein
MNRSSQHKHSITPPLLSLNCTSDSTLLTCRHDQSLQRILAHASAQSTRTVGPSDRGQAGTLSVLTRLYLGGFCIRHHSPRSYHDPTLRLILPRAMWSICMHALRLPQAYLLRARAQACRFYIRCHRGTHRSHRGTPLPPTTSQAIANVAVHSLSRVVWR